MGSSNSGITDMLAPFGDYEFRERQPPLSLTHHGAVVRLPRRYRQHLRACVEILRTLERARARRGKLSSRKSAADLRPLERHANSRFLLGSRLVDAIEKSD